MGLRHWIVLLILAVTAGPGWAGEAWVPARGSGTFGQPDRANDRTAPSIVVSGDRRPVTVDGVVPEDRAGRNHMASYGAGTVTELIDELGLRTRGAGGGGRPVVLVDSRRISGFSDIRDLPREAILRVDILPEETALRYGYPLGRQVVNLVLRPNFHATSGRAGIGAAKDIGRPEAESGINVARIVPGRRWSADAAWKRSSGLLEGERPLAGSVGHLDTALDSQPDTPSIVVIGRRLRGAILADVLPEIELRPEDIAGFGAGTIGELLEQLSPQTTGAGSPNARPLVLINGQRTLGLDEIRGLPPEAVLRIEILPEHVALRYGLRPGNKVVNLLLQPHFHAVTAETSHGTATDGGRSVRQVRMNIARIAPIGRWSLDASYLHESSLSEGERPLAGGLGPLRTLLPGTQQLSLGGSYTSSLSPTTNLRLNARIEEQSAKSRTGQVPPGFGADDRPILALRRESRTRSASLAAALNGAVGSWIWSATASYDRVHQRIETELPVAAGPPTLDLVRSRTQSATFELLTFGELASLPSGPLTVSIGGRLEASEYRNRSLLALVPGPGELSRRSATGQVNFEVPLLDGSMEGLEGLGQLSANLNFALERVEAFGTLKTIGAELRWTPARWVSLTLSASERESAPDAQSLGQPATIFPNVRTFDFVTGETVDVLRIEGGNPGLLAQDLGTISANLSLRPFRFRNLLVSANYTRSRISDPVGALSLALPEFEAAFPERFSRAADGRLASIDARPLNFARIERDELRWGFSFFKNFATTGATAVTEDIVEAEPAGAEAAREAGFDLGAIRRAPANRGTLQLALYHTWRLRDRLLVREGIPAIDFLANSPAGLQGGTPQHRVEIQAALSRAGFGARLTGKWQSATNVRVQDRALSYGSLARFDLRLFADLGQRQGMASRAPWLRGTRIAIEVENVLNARPRVRDETGRTPLGLQPSYLDPAGRTIRIILRKLF
jgi:iron complex outermembrane recepter protein